MSTDIVHYFCLFAFIYNVKGHFIDCPLKSPFFMHHENKTLWWDTITFQPILVENPAGEHQDCPHWHLKINTSQNSIILVGRQNYIFFFKCTYANTCNSWKTTLPMAVCRKDSGTVPMVQHKE